MNHSPLKITVIGDVMLDRYWFGHVQRISPEAPIPIVNINNKEDRLGGAANVALNISTLEHGVSLIGMIGIDIEGQCLQSLCAEKKIMPILIENEAYTTTTKLRIISRHQHMLRCDFEEAHTAISLSNEMIEILNQAIDSTDIVVLSDYGKGFLSDTERLITYARARHKTIIIDPKGSDFTKYKGATIITPNRSEFETIVGPCHTEDELLEKGEKLRQSLDLQAILITRSEQGMTLIEANKMPITFPAKARDVYDVTGAGDTVLALIATSIAEGKSFREAAIIANTAASIVVGKLGASQVSKEELNNALTEAERAHHLILNKFELKNAINKAHQRNETIVMTNGCFDLLHKGHVSYLEKARQLGDRLVVALNSDASVKRLKGDNRPIMDESSRATVLASLRSVDWVVIFDEDTPEALIREICPNILVKGCDYKIEDIAGAQFVIDHGGKVELIDFIDGYSTTHAIEKIKNRD